MLLSVLGHTVTSGRDYLINRMQTMRLRIGIAMAIGFVIAQKLPAQNHCASWWRATVSVPVIHPIKVDGEAQYRSQNGWNRTSPVDYPLLYSFRLWMHYQYRENTRFSVSPLAYFANYKRINSAEDEHSKPNDEWRYSAAIDFQHNLGSRFFGFNRSALEYRWFPDQRQQAWRLRDRWGLAFQFHEKHRASLWNEPLRWVLKINCFAF